MYANVLSCVVLDRDWDLYTGISHVFKISYAAVWLLP